MNTRDCFNTLPAIFNTQSAFTNVKRSVNIFPTENKLKSIASEWWPENESQMEWSEPPQENKISITFSI